MFPASVAFDGPDAYSNPTRALIEKNEDVIESILKQVGFIDDNQDTNAVEGGGGPLEFQVPVKQSNVVTMLLENSDEALGEALGYRVDDVEIVSTVDNIEVL